MTSPALSADADSKASHSQKSQENKIKEKTKVTAPKAAVKKQSKIAAKIAAMKAEQERIRLEEERRIKEEEERERKRLEEIQRLKELRLKQLQERKERKAKQKEENRKKQEEERRQRVRAQFAGTVIIPALDGGVAKRGVRKQNKPKVKKQKEQSNTPNDSTSNSTSTSQTDNSLVPSPQNTDNLQSKTSSDNTTSTTDAKDISAPEHITQKDSESDDVVEDWEKASFSSDDIEENHLPGKTQDVDENVSHLKAEETSAVEKNKADETNKHEAERTLRNDEQVLNKNETKDEKQTPIQQQKQPPPQPPLPPLQSQLQPQPQSQPQPQQKLSIKDLKEDDLRSPIVCVLGHVDSGKTSLLDKMRHTNVQQGEAGGITQQIGATFFPIDVIKERTAALQEKDIIRKLFKKTEFTLKIPGLLILDTPGHASFSNLRIRGSSLCDIAILVVNIMEGLKPQTIESINILRSKKIPFIVALNQIDHLTGWKVTPDAPVIDSLAKQNENTMSHFKERVATVITHFAEQSLNAALYYENKNFGKVVSLIPTSAKTGEGIPDLLFLLTQLTQHMLTNKLLRLSTLQCSILEVKVTEGLGTTIDVILANGILREGDHILVCTWNGPIITTIRALLTPQPLREIRVKGQYIHHKEVRAAQGVKIVASDLEGAVPGTQLYVINDVIDNQEALQDLKEKVMEDVKGLQAKVDKSGVGISVQTSTLGSLEALLEYLTKECKVPVANINIGPIHKKDVVKASVMHDHKAPEYACILAFDVKPTQEAQQVAEELNVRIFQDNVIYQLFDQFKRYWDQVQEERKKNTKIEPVFPCILSIVGVFRTSNPILLGVHVKKGILKIGTPLCVPSRDYINLGKVVSIQREHTSLKEAVEGEDVAIKIEQVIDEQKYMYGRHFDEHDELYSRITRESLDALKEHHTDVCKRKDIFELLLHMKKVFKIV
jgi:translation initiation factor 5B